MKKTMLAVTCMLLFCSLLAARTNTRNRLNRPGPYSGTNCSSDNNLPSTGLPTKDTIAGSTTGYYFLVLSQGHSYTAEVVDPVDLFDGNSMSLSLIESDCVTVEPSTDTTSIDPNIGGGTGDRISWIAPATGSVNLALTNPDASSYTYLVSLTDTTLHNPRWSTFNGYITQYGFLNNTASDISGVLTVTESNGTQHTLNVTVPAESMVLRTIGPGGDIVMPQNRFGSGQFAFIGPPGSITADAYFVAPGATVVVPSTFAPRNFQH